MSSDTAAQRYEQGPWSLTALLPNAEEETYAARLAEIETDVEYLEGRRQELAESIEATSVTEIFGRYESLVERLYVLSAYASLWFSEDTQSQAALGFKNRVQNELTTIQNRILFLTLWWKGLEDADFERLLPSEETHADLRFFLEDLRRTRPFTLDETSEQIINAKDANGVSALVTLYSMLTNRLEFELEVDGELQQLSRDALMANVYSPDADRRAAAYRSLYGVYAEESTVLGQIYSNRVRDWHSENVTLRGFSSPIAVRNLSNDVPDPAIETLLDVAARNPEVFRRYFRLKAGWVGMEKLRRYDLYAPLAVSDRRIEYPEAVSMVLETFESFDSGVARQARRVFDDGHIDSEVRKGKRGGAFCSTVLPSQTPWVLVNYTGKLRDVSTLAHELGHAVHSMAAEDHTVLTQHSCLPLAETASVFAEMLLTDRLLAEEENPAARREILASAIDDAYATVMRQAFFVRFELAAHQAILDGKSTDELNEIYFATLTEQFGDSLEIGDEFRHEWISIPHIYHTPFYCYAYSFGQLLVLALYQRYKEQGDAFVPGYLRMLARGGSQRPQTVLEEMGIDMADAAFWQGGFDFVSGLVDELESLPSE